MTTKSNETEELTRHPSSLQSGVQGPILCKFESLFMYLFQTIALNHLNDPNQCVLNFRIKTANAGGKTLYYLMTSD